MKKLAKVIIMLMVALTFVSARNVAAATDTYTDIDVKVRYGQTEARQMLTRINEFRTGSETWYWDSTNTKKIECNNLNTLDYDYGLELVAMLRAAENAVSYGHTRPNNGQCTSAFEVVGVDSYIRGENIAAGYKTEEDVFIAWREDDEPYSGQGHRRNMLNANYTRIGIGHVNYNGVDFWVQILGIDTGVEKTSANDKDTVVSVNVSDSRITSVSTSYVDGPTEVSVGNTVSVPSCNATISVSGTVSWGDITTETPVEFTYGDDEYISVKDGKMTGLKAGLGQIKGKYAGKEFAFNVLVIDENDSALEPEAEGFEYEKLSDGTMMVTDTTLSGDIVFPEKIMGRPVTKIKPQIFYGYRGITSVYIPATVKAPGNFDYLFSYCYDLKEINVSPDNPELCSVDGILYSKDMTTLYNYPAAKTGDIFITDERTKYFCCTSFASQRYLKKLYVSNNKNTWAGYTFYNTPNLTVYYLAGGSCENSVNSHISLGRCHEKDELYPTFKLYTEDTKPTLTPVPTVAPTKTPTKAPTAAPTETPVPTVTEVPTEVPTEPPVPTVTEVPTEAPTETPVPTVTEVPTEAPTEIPAPTDTPAPTMAPTGTEAEGFSYEILPDGTIMITDCTLTGAVVIPDEIDGKKVTRLANELFLLKENITTIMLPAYLKAPQSGFDLTFVGCSDLQEILVSEKNKELRSVNGILYKNDLSVLYAVPMQLNVSTLIIPSETTYICDGAMALPLYVSKVYIDNKNAQWEADSFCGSYGMDVYYRRYGKSETCAKTFNRQRMSYSYDESYPYYSSFSRLPSKRAMSIITAGYTIVKNGGIYRTIEDGKAQVEFVEPVNSNVSSFEIPAKIKENGTTYTVVKVAENAFAKNKKLKSVVIGKNVKTIGKKAFYGCKKLKTITVNSSKLKTVGKNAFRKINANAVITVPEAKLAAYGKILKTTAKLSAK